MKLLTQATYIRYESAKLSKFTQVSSQTSLYFFTDDSLKIKKGLELVSRPHFSYKFFVKKFSFVILHTLVRFHHHTVYFPNDSVKCVSCFRRRHFDDVMTYEYLKS